MRFRVKLLTLTLYADPCTLDLLGAKTPTVGISCANRLELGVGLGPGLAGAACSFMDRARGRGSVRAEVRVPGFG